MQIAILGPLVVRDAAGRELDVAGARLRTVLTRLALDAERPVGVDTLVAAVWDDRPPAEATNALQTLVSRLRRALGDAGLVVQGGAGYRLALDPEQVDAHRFERLTREAATALQGGAAAEAAATLDDALALWRGPALDGAGDGLADAARRLDGLRLAARVDRAAAADRIGDTSRVADLQAVLAEHPLDERATGLLMRALGADGRQADALHAYERLRARLADELGVDPSAETRAIHLGLLRAADEPAPVARRSNLKAQLTSFVGREDEVARIGKALELNRLVTLVGPGGAGKTRLATEAATQVLDSAPDGVWLVELATVTAGTDVPQAVLGAVGAREIHLMDRHPSTARDALTRLRDVLAEQRALLVLDNCEHVIDASARLAEQLLGYCPDLRVLATSREPLDVLGEALLAVPPLGQPVPGTSAADALEYPAVRLFADRAAAVRQDFTVDGASVAPVVEIVRRLDGLPLAIELAAARLRSLPIDEVAARLSDRFRLLTGGNRAALPRHRTLRAVVEWSWGLLAEHERSLAEHLAVFPSGVTVASAAAVRPDGIDEADVADLLASLVDKSLLQPVGDGHRMRMLETIREYGIERLAERGRLAAVRHRHAEHFAALLAEAEPHLTTAGQLPWFALLTTERDNILAALRHRCEQGDADGALRIAVGLAGFAMMMGEHSDIATWMGDALDVEGGTDATLRLVARGMYALNVTAAGPSAADGGRVDDLAAISAGLEHIGPLSDAPLLALLRPAIAFFAEDEERTLRYLDEALAGEVEWARAAALMLRANLAENSGDVAGMRADIEQALARFRALGERWGMASTLRTLAGLNTLDGDLDAAAAAYVEALELTHEMHSHDDEVFVYGGLAEIALRRGDPAAARRYITLARESADEHRSGMESMFTLAVLGDFEFRAGDREQGRAHVQEALARLPEAPAPHPAHNHIRAMVLGTAARIALADGDDGLAAVRLREGYAAAVSTNDLPIMAVLGVSVAHHAAHTGRPADAARVLGAATRLRGAEDPTALDIRTLRERLRAELGDAGFEREYAAGRAMTRDEAIERLDPGHRGVG